jgi:hypothetical protein
MFCPTSRLRAGRKDPYSSEATLRDRNVFLRYEVEKYGNIETTRFSDEQRSDSFNFAKQISRAFALSLFHVSKYAEMRRANPTIEGAGGLSLAGEQNADVRD